MSSSATETLYLRRSRGIISPFYAIGVICCVRRRGRKKIQYGAQYSPPNCGCPQYIRHTHTQCRARLWSIDVCVASHWLVEQFAFKFLQRVEGGDAKMFLPSVKSAAAGLFCKDSELQGFFFVFQRFRLSQRISHTSLHWTSIHFLLHKSVWTRLYEHYRMQTILTYKENLKLSVAIYNIFEINQGKLM